MIHPRTSSVAARLRASLILATLPFLVAVTLAAGAEKDSPTGWLGVFLDGTSQPDAGAPDSQSGVSIRGVIEESPAARAGLRAQDRIVAVETTRVASSNELMTTLSGMEPGRWISLTVQRGDDQLSLDARLTERPTESETKRLRVRQGWIGAEAIDLPETLREYFGAPDDAGVMISNVLEGSPAESAGLELGDVVYEVDGNPIDTAKRLHLAVTMGGIGNVVEITVMRNGSEITLAANITTRPETDEPATIRKKG